MSTLRKQAAETAVFLAAAELARRGYDVRLLEPRAPLADLEVHGPGGAVFKVDVKGKGRTGRWLVKPKPHTPDLFYILVRLGKTPNGHSREQDRFYVIDQAQVAELTRINDAKPALSGFSSKAAEPWRDGWDRLPR